MPRGGKAGDSWTSFANWPAGRQFERMARASRTTGTDDSLCAMASGLAGLSPGAGSLIPDCQISICRLCVVGSDGAELGVLLGTNGE